MCSINKLFKKFCPPGFFFAVFELGHFDTLLTIIGLKSVRCRKQKIEEMKKSDDTAR